VSSILRNHFREHNRSVLFASGATLVFAVVGWLVVYGLCYWFTIAFLTVKEGLQFKGTENFNRNFFSSVLVLYAATLLDRWIFRYDSQAVDRRPFSETLLDIVLFLPRMSLAVFENFGVWVRLSERQMQAAAGLLELVRERGRFALQEIPVVIPSERDSTAIVTALRIAQVLDARISEGTTWLYIGSLAPAEFAPLVTPPFGAQSIPRSRWRAQFDGEATQKKLPHGES
jgi:hypothetical protein